MTEKHIKNLTLQVDAAREETSGKASKGKRLRSTYKKLKEEVSIVSFMSTEQSVFLYDYEYEYMITNISPSC